MALYSDKVMDHFQHPRNVGEIENASGVGTVGNAKCGDIMRIFLDIDDETHIITDKNIRPHVHARICRFATLLIIKTLINMAITIKPALRKNPQDKAAAAKYYAQVVLAPEMKQKQIVDQIADRCKRSAQQVENQNPLMPAQKRQKAAQKSF